MKIVLDFYLHPHRRHPLSETFELSDMRRDLVLQCGDDNELHCRFYSGKFFNDTVDITDWVLDFIVKNNPTDTDEDAVLNKHITDLEDPINGKVEIELTPSESAGLAGNYIYQLKCTRSSGKIKLLCEGILTFKSSLFGE
jgi:hypothetical protein